MNTLLIKKVNSVWSYEIYLNGVNLPFVYDVKIVREENDIPRCIISIILPKEEISGYKVIVEE